MSFLGMTAAQALALGAATTAAILALYFLKLRRRRVVVPSTLLWSKVLDERQARSILERLRNPISALIAVIIGLLLALSVARPEIEALTGKHRRVAIVLDTSPTMLARTADGQTRWARAVKQAESLLDGSGPTTEFRISDTSAGAVTTFEVDRTALRQRIAEMRPWAADLRFPDTESADETWFVSDGVARLQIPPNTKRVNVFENAPNVAINAFDIRSEPGSPLQYTAWLEVQNYGRNSTSVAIAVAGASAPAITRNLVLEPGGRFQEAFNVSGFSGDVTASIKAEGDAFALDDQAFAYIPVRQKTRTLLVTTGNAYLQKALELDEHVELHVVEPAKFAESTDIDAYVFDRFAPAARPSHPALVIGAPAAPWLPAATGILVKPAVASRLDDHPAMRRVALHDVAIKQAAKIDAAGLVVLAASTEAPLIVASEVSAAPKWLMLTFALEASDFPFQAGFPLFIDNTLSWFAREPLALRRTPGLVRVPLKDATIETADGKPVAAETHLGETIFEADSPGLFVATHEGVRQRVAVNLTNRSLSNINDTQVIDAASKASTPPFLQHELWFYMLLAAIALIVIEWFTYHRRITL